MTTPKLHKRLCLAAILLTSLSGCGTAYHADFSVPKNADEQTNPYQQKVPTDGVASFVRDIINRK